MSFKDIIKNKITRYVFIGVFLFWIIFYIVFAIIPGICGSLADTVRCSLSEAFLNSLPFILIYTIIFGIPIAIISGFFYLKLKK